MKSQKEITETNALLKPDGSLTTAGWSPFPKLDNNLENANFYGLKFLQPFRIKRWDYYGITTPKYYFSFTISDIGYLGMVFAYVVNFENKTYHEETLTLPLGGGVALPRNSESGETRYAGSKASLSFSVEDQQRKLSVLWPNFEQREALGAEIFLTQTPEHESMNLVIPIEKKRFYFNRKINCMPANGWIDYLGKRHRLKPNHSLGNLDWGRGVWAYRSFWVWASASGFLENGQTIGLNMGYGFGDTSAATENAFILDGKIHKLGEIKFNYNNKNFYDPWTMQSDDGRLELVFTPFLDRTAKTDIKLLTSEVHQMFGNYEGFVITDSGEKIIIKNLIGFAEEHFAKW
jgi:hypothetical protein